MELARRASHQEAQSPTEEKEPKLKCDEMRLIFQRLPTSELTRFISNIPKPPLGKFWSQELKFVIEKRLPFSIKATATSNGFTSGHVIFDCNGSRVAEIKRPQYFRLSPICELIESVDVPVITPIDSSWTPPRFVFPTTDIISILTNLDTIVLSGPSVTSPNLRDPVEIAAVLKPAVMARIQSLTLAHFDYYRQSEEPLLEIIGRATNLKKLGVPCIALNSPVLLTALPHLPGHCSSLESLTIRRLFLSGQSVEPLLGIITTRFNGLRELFLPLSVTGPKVGNVFAWIDEAYIDERRIQSRAAWWPEAVSDFTDFRIEAYKTSGPLKGSTFNARISEWTEKRKRVFDDKLV